MKLEQIGYSFILSFSPMCYSPKITYGKQLKKLTLQKIQPCRKLERKLFDGHSRKVTDTQNCHYFAEFSSIYIW